MAGFNDVKDSAKESPLLRRKRELEEMGTGERTPSPRRSGEPEPGSDAYLKRRERDYERDLKENPRR